MHVSGRFTAKQDSRGRWSGRYRGRHICGGWADKTTALAKAREYVGWRGLGGAFGGGYVKRGK